MLFRPPSFLGHHINNTAKFSFTPFPAEQGRIFNWLILSDVLLKIHLYANNY